MVRMISKTNCGDTMWNLNWVVISLKRTGGTTDRNVELYPQFFLELITTQLRFHMVSPQLVNTCSSGRSALGTFRHGCMLLQAITECIFFSFLLSYFGGSPYKQTFKSASYLTALWPNINNWAEKIEAWSHRSCGLHYQQNVCHMLSFREISDVSNATNEIIPRASYLITDWNWLPGSIFRFQLPVTHFVKFWLYIWAMGTQLNLWLLNNVMFALLQTIIFIKKRFKRLNSDLTLCGDFPHAFPQLWYIVSNC